MQEVLGGGRSHMLSVETMDAKEHVGDAQIFSQPGACSLQLGSQGLQAGDRLEEFSCWTTEAA